MALDGNKKPIASRSAPKDMDVGIAARSASYFRVGKYFLSYQFSITSNLSFSGWAGHGAHSVPTPDLSCASREQEVTS